jgi:hypothetical protein
MKPLFEHFYLPKKRGRPSSRRKEIISADDPDLSWLKAYPQALYDLSNNPLAWSLQFGTRDFFAWAWDVSVEQWIISPDDFPLYPNWEPLLWRDRELLPPKQASELTTNVTQQNDTEILPRQNFTAPGNFFARLWKLLDLRPDVPDLPRPGPVVTIESLHKQGFAIYQMADFRQLYERALDGFSREVYPHRIQTDAFHTPMDHRLDLYAIPTHFTKKEKLDAFNSLIQQEFGRGWDLEFDRLCAYGVLEWIDMRFFELLTGIPIKDDVKLTIIKRSFRGAVQLRGKELYQSLGIKGPIRDMRTTLRFAHEVMDLQHGSQKLEDLTAAAASYLEAQWRTNNGRGDKKFALSTKEAGSWKWD